MNRLIAISVLIAALAVTAAPVFAANPGTTGQPSQSCEEQPLTPGHAATASGSAFNPDGIAGTHYAGEQPQNSRNSANSSQYDVACSKQQPL